MNNSETLSSLAMLRVHAELGRDYFDYLVPFVSYVLQQRRPATVTDTDTQCFLREEFGLVIPTHACGFVLQRLAKRHILQRSHGVYQIVGEFKDSKLDERRAAARRQQQAVVNNLVQHAKENHKLSWTTGQAEAAMVQYLARFSVECLKAFTKGTALPEVEDQAGVAVFVVSSFVKHAHDYQVELFDAVTALVKGHMLANALLCSDLESLQKKFGGVTFYLDTPFIMQLLRFWGKAAYDAAAELLQLLKRLNGTVAVFEHTIDEVLNVLDSAERNLALPGAAAHPMVLSLRREGFAVADLVMARGTFDRFLEQYSIIRKKTPGYTRDFQIDEKTLELFTETEVHYLRDKARDYDVNSIRSIYELRRSKHPLRLEDANAVLVTTNTALAQAAFSFGKTHESSSEVPTVITDFSLANIAWLKAPLAAPDLPRLELVAECYATMEPSPGLWSRYSEEIDSLLKRGTITSADHEVLRGSLIARDHLMAMTLGSEAAFAKGTSIQVLERLKSELVLEKDAELQIERQRVEQSEAKAAVLAAKQTQIQKRVDLVASKTALIAKWVCFITAFVIIAASLLAVSGVILETPEKPWMHWMRRILVMVSIIWAVADATIGLSIMHIAESCAMWVERRVAGYLVEFFKLDGDGL